MGLLQSLGRTGGRAGQSRAFNPRASGTSTWPQPPVYSYVQAASFKKTPNQTICSIIYMVLQRTNPTTAQLSSSTCHQLLEKHFASTPPMAAWMNCTSTRCTLEKIVLDTFGTWHLGE